jgi:tRNA-Thr(GGU) m(6)t(6)A37 methyltransferase TsaA
MFFMRRSLMFGWFWAVVARKPGPARAKEADAEKKDDPVAPSKLTLYPIGKVEKVEGRSRLKIAARYAPALLGLGGFSHVHVYWWFDRNDSPEKRRVLQVRPRGNRANPLTGVFATRSPVRPNLIATTLCRIVQIQDHVVDVDDIDAFGGTPILDLKPYIPASDCARGEVRTPDWL